MNLDKLCKKLHPGVHMNISEQYHKPRLCDLGNKALTCHDPNELQNLNSLSHQM